MILKKSQKIFESYPDWIVQVPDSITKDPLWNFGTYKKALFLADLVWFDCDKLLPEYKGRPIAEQLIRSCGSIPANIEEGYGRGFGNDYARFLRIAEGSARESRGWYYRGRHLLPVDVLEHRLRLCDEIIAGLTSAALRQRSKNKSD